MGEPFLAFPSGEGGLPQSGKTKEVLYEWGLRLYCDRKEMSCILSQQRRVAKRQGDLFRPRCARPPGPTGPFSLKTVHWTVFRTLEPFPRGEGYGRAVFSLPLWGRWRVSAGRGPLWMVSAPAFQQERNVACSAAAKARGETPGDLFRPSLTAGPPSPEGKAIPGEPPFSISIRGGQ